MSGLIAIAAAERRLRASGGIDRDADGVGEFGFLDALPGLLEPRRLDGAAARGTERGFRDSDTAGVYLRDGYCFRVYLPGVDGRGVDVLTAEQRPAHPARAEQSWCGYAWPMYYGVTGTQCFFIDERGVVLTTDNRVQSYSGVQRGPRSDAALAPQSGGLLGGALASDLGRDGQRWVAAPSAPIDDVRVRVEDDSGTPVVGLRVAVLAPERMFEHPWFRAADLDRIIRHDGPALPCTIGKTGRDGALSVAGWTGGGTALALLGSNGRPIPAHGARTTYVDATLHVSLPPALMRLVQIEIAETGAIDSLQALIQAEGDLATLDDTAAVCREDDAQPSAIVVDRDGYRFRLQQSGRSDSGWECYAWPLLRGRTGLRAFFASHHGDVLACANDRRFYSGHQSAPVTLAAFTRTGVGDLVEAHMLRTSGLDGEAWERVR